jgi:hypothetical protein
MSATGIGAKPKKIIISTGPRVPTITTEFKIMEKKREKAAAEEAAEEEKKKEEYVKTKFKNALAKIENGNLIFTATVRHDEHGYNIYENPLGDQMQGIYFQITIKVINGLLFITYLIEHPAPLRLVLIVEHSDREKIPLIWKNRTGSFQTKNGFTDEEINTMGMALLNSTLLKGFISGSDKELLTTWIGYGFSNLTFYMSLYGAMATLPDIERRINPQTQSTLSSALLIPNGGGTRSRRKSKSKKNKKSKSKRRKTKKTKRRRR